MLNTVIVGTGRSGTRYCSALLKASGVRCGHEEVYTHSVAMNGRRPEWNGLDVDASWMAVPFVHGHELRSIHVVREPLSVVRSMLQLGWFYPGERKQISRIVERHRPEIVRYKCREDKALALWLEWNRIARNVSIETFRIGELGYEGARRLEFVTMFGGVDAGDEAVSEILSDEVMSNRKTSRKIHQHDKLEWSSFDSKLADMARADAERYGFLYG